MNKVLAFLSFIFLVSSCDQSIESRLSKQKGKSNEPASKVENIESKAPDLKSDKASESENKDSKLAESTEKLDNQVTQPESEKAQSQNTDIDVSEKKDATLPENNIVSSEQAKEHLPKIKESSSSLTQASVSKASKNISKPVKKNEQPKVVKNVTSKPSLPKEDKVVKNVTSKLSLPKEDKEDKKVMKNHTVTASKKKLQESKPSNSTKLEVVKEEKVVTKLPPAKVEPKANESDGTYENGQLVSNFTIEELRLGAPRPLSKEEIKYFKRLCRYALMSEQEIIENGCQTKKVTFSR